MVANNFKTGSIHLLFITFPPVSAWIILATKAGIQRAGRYSSVPNPHDILFANLFYGNFAKTA